MPISFPPHRSLTPIPVPTYYPVWPSSSSPSLGYQQQQQPSFGYPQQQPSFGYPQQQPSFGYPQQQQPPLGSCPVDDCSSTVAVVDVTDPRLALFLARLPSEPDLDPC